MPKFETKKIIYMVIDIRESSTINNHLIEHHGNQALFDFYKKFKNICDNVALKEYKAIFNKQVGDRVDYAWEHRKYKNAIDAAISISDEITQTLNLPIYGRISIGIGMCFGEGIFDSKENEVKTDCPRISALLQEGRYGIFIKKKPDYIPDGYSIIENIINSRGNLYKSYQIVPSDKVKLHIALSSSNLEKHTRGILKDTHLHIEGIDLSTPTVASIVHNSIDEIKKDKEKALRFHKVTGTNVDHIAIHNNHNLPPDAQSEPFSFDKFLQQLHLAKCCLCSSEKNAFRFMREALRVIACKTPTFTISIVPSIPSDFPYLDQKLWFKGVIQEIKESTSDNLSNIPPTIVIETKRQHLPNDIYLENLKFLKLLKDKCPNINIAIGLCDNASRFPLSTQAIQKKYMDYVNRARAIDPDIQIQVHEMEQYCEKDPLKEIHFLMDFFDKSEIRNVEWIHLSYLNPSAKVVTKIETRKLLDRMHERKDRIIVCYSSNKCLNTPCVLDCPMIFDYLINEKIEFALGTDNPFPFKVEGIHSEFDTVKDHLLELDYKYADVQKLMQILARNSATSKTGP